MAEQRLAKRVLLIGWDAADWKVINPLLDAGKLPNLSRLVDGGVIGNIATLQPCLSPILWTSIATGKTADKHGITGFVEPNPEAEGLRLASSTSRTTKALWNIFSQQGLQTIVIGWFASHPAEPIRGVCVSNRLTEDPPINPKSPWPMVDGCVHPREKADAMADLRMHPGEFSYQEMAAFISDLKSVNIKSDHRPFLLAQALAKAASVHNVATSLMQSEPWDFLAVYYDALDVAGHDFMPFHPPRLPHVTEADFARYSGVINALYQHHDQMLGRLLDLAGPDTTVVLVSDHGFHSDHLRPQTWSHGHTPETQAAAWHRQFGVLVMHGPHIRKDERVYGATLLHVAPTILRLFGLPADKDMHGRVLVDAFDTPIAPIAPIASWDAEGGAEFQHPPDLRQDPYASAAVIQRLVEMGYLPAAADDVRKAVDLAKAESQFNLAVVHLHHGRPQQAQAILDELVKAYPDESRYALRLARACFDVGQITQAEELVATVESRGIRTADSDLIWIAIRLQQDQRDAALERIRDAEKRYPPSAALQYLLGAALLTQRHWPEAQAAFERGIDLDPDFAHCHNGLAHALLMQGQPEQAGESALRAVGLMYFFPQAHYHLAKALIELGEPQRAIRSLEIAVSQSPRFFDAHKTLAKLYEQMGDPLRALRHQRLGDGYADIEKM
jgi:predicted AlkP superfamily phosphohydrolase/phosphomutase/tetratricopeptide (TPR) repeat protein